MPNDTKEPQSYGSQGDWVTGRTGEQVHDQKSTPPAEHADFYEGRREAESSAPHQGGHVSPVQRSESEKQVPSDEGVRSPAPYTDQKSGAKRDSYFKKRDYE